MFGFLNVYKPKGITSHDVVARLRKVLKIKQIGHTGTLDPFAEGVLPIAIGKASRLIEYLNDDKAYRAVIQLGKSTDTYDLDGKVVNESYKKVTLEEINSILPNFRGEIEQIPPIYSAIKVNGKKLYEYARNGETAEIQPRKVVITKLEVEDFDFENQTLEIIVECSKGTYIRSIANDLGEALGTYGYLIKLERIKAGDFIVNTAIPLENLDTQDNVLQNLQNPLNFLHFPCYNLNSEELKKVSNGNQISANINNGEIVLADSGKIVGIGESQNGIIKCKKIFI